MQASDKALLLRKPLKYGAFLERVINAGNTPYSVIVYKGHEVCSMPTEQEKRIIERWENESHVFWTNALGVVDG